MKLTRAGEKIKGEKPDTGRDDQEIRATKTGSQATGDKQAKSNSNKKRGQKSRGET